MTDTAFSSQTTSQPPQLRTADQTPTTVFSGFLGSGKTTIISHLVETLQNRGEQVVYIKNEIGDVNVDGELMEGKHIQTKELLNGCICCTLVGPFIQAIDEVLDTLKPDRVIIEASGAADPAAIALMIDSHPRLKRDGVISVIDVVNFDGYKDLSQTARNQTRFTDLLVFNKVEQVDINRKRAVVDWVRELNDHSPVVEAPGGILSPEVAFGIATKELSSLLEELEHDHAEQAEHHQHLETDSLQNFALAMPLPLTVQQLEKLLQALPRNVYRVKGFCKTPEGNCQLLNKVGIRHSVEAAPAGFECTKNMLVLIGFRVKEQQAQLTELVHTLL